MAVGDRYRITDAQLYLSEGVLNVYHYKQTSGAGGSAEDLRTAFFNVLLQEILALQSNNLSHVAITTINLDNLDDFDINIPTSSNIGEDTTLNPLASFYAFSFQYVRATRASRHGWKRIAGIPEEAVVGNTVVGSYNTIAVGVASYMGGNLNSGNAVYTPVIVRKNIVPAASLDFGIQDVVFKGVTTQNTRKAGRGS